MPNYRRVLIPGVTYFFTVVTYKRRKILVIPEGRHMLRDVVDEVRQLRPFVIVHRKGAKSAKVVFLESKC